MNEYLLQYLWKHSLFAPSDLSTVSGDALTVLFPGNENTNSGPDFLEAKIKIGGTLWVGNVELHLSTSDWLKHRHDQDPLYRNIILHVVLRHDIDLQGYQFPTLELKKHIDETLLDRYRDLMNSIKPIPCAAQLNKIPELIWKSWLERLLAERWEERIREWQHLWQMAGNDWRSLLYYRLAANFGFHVNRDAFLDLACSIPLNILVKHRPSLFQTEALLFGQSGLLEVAAQDDYTKDLESEYHFLRRKYQLVPLKASRWKFMRLRPPNFPTIRIAQFATLVHKSIQLLSKIIEVRDEKTMAALLDIQASSYWDNHYRLGEISETIEVKKLGNDSVRNIIINTVAPMQYLYAGTQGKPRLRDTSIELLRTVPAESNKIIREWRSMGVEPDDASESQALIQLFNNYCTPKKCLNCAIGNRLVGRS